MRKVDAQTVMELSAKLPIEKGYIATAFCPVGKYRK